MSFGSGRARLCATSASNESHERLLDALKGHGILAENGPDVAKRRADMGFAAHRTSPQTNMAWLADSMQSMLHPGNLRKIIDVCISSGWDRLGM